MKVIGVKIKSWEPVLEFNPRDLKIKRDDYVILESDQGLEAGKVLYVQEVPEMGEELRPVLRKAIESDLKKIRYYLRKKQEIFEMARAKIKEHNLEMKLVDVHFVFDGSKLTLAFTAEGRIDFRDLLKDLTRHFQKSIRLQQIGSRDEAKGTGGYGMCGREICCARFLNELKSVTTDMARLQETTQKGSEKNSGLCGRLKCCLAYEAEFYADLAKGTPQVLEEVKTKLGKGVVIGRNLLNGILKVKLAKDGSEVELPWKSKRKATEE